MKSFLTRTHSKSGASVLTQRRREAEDLLVTIFMTIPYLDDDVIIK